MSGSGSVEVDVLIENSVENINAGAEAAEPGDAPAGGGTGPVSNVHHGNEIEA